MRHLTQFEANSISGGFNDNYAFIYALSLLNQEQKKEVLESLLIAHGTMIGGVIGALGMGSVTSLLTSSCAAIVGSGTIGLIGGGVLAYYGLDYLFHG